MRSRLLPASVLLACLTMASCSSSKTPASAPPTPLPAEYAAQCPPPIEPADNSADAGLVALKEMYDLYGTCAGRHVDLVNWIERSRR